MKLAFTLDYLLANTQQRADTYKVEGDPLRSEAMRKDEWFWATIYAHEDVAEFAQMLRDSGTEYYVLVERPASLIMITASWLRRHDFQLPNDHIIMDTIKRYDCRMNDVDYLIDYTDHMLDWYQYERVVPVILDRGRGDSLPVVLGEIFEKSKDLGH
jgi:hypothetical protein